MNPKSVYDELVDLFIEAKGKRQVILVTHNANLVVNTDADQIIIAEANNHESGSLPDITYTSGGWKTPKSERLSAIFLKVVRRHFVSVLVVYG